MFYHVFIMYSSHFYCLEEILSVSVDPILFMSLFMCVFKWSRNYLLGRGFENEHEIIVYKFILFCEISYRYFLQKAIGWFIWDFVGISYCFSYFPCFYWCIFFAVYELSYIIWEGSTIYISSILSDFLFLTSHFTDTFWYFHIFFHVSLRFTVA